MSRNSFELLRDVLDHEIVDAEGTSCGTVDDIEIAISDDAEPSVKSLLVGPGAWGRRVPALIELCARMLFGTQIVRVPWHEVAEVSETIRLKSMASELGLGRIDRKVGKWLSHLPRANV
jgi:sporulation protein YlmC with PRC-barrel domain